MRNSIHRIGATFYALWGILHVVGGGAILAALASEGGTAALAMLGTAAPPSHLPASTTPVIDHLVGYHAFNILWIGLFVTVVALFFNWRNSRSGYWVNLVVVSTFDMGLLVFEVLPGSIATSDAMVGVLLWIPAAVFSTIGRWNVAEPRTSEPATLSLDADPTP